MTLRTSARALFGRRREPILYVLVGGWNTLFGYGVFALLYHLLHDEAGVAEVPGSMAALIIATIICTANNYVLYRTFVFRSHGAVWRELPRFSVVYLVALAVNLVVLPLALRELPLNVYAVQGVFTARSSWRLTLRTSTSASRRRDTTAGRPRRLTDRRV